MAELTHILRLEKSSLSGLVDRVEHRGLLNRTMSATDRHAITVALTPRSKHIADAFHDESSGRLLEIVSYLSATDRDRFTRLVSRIVHEESVPPVFGNTALGAQSASTHRRSVLFDWVRGARRLWHGVVAR